MSPIFTLLKKTEAVSGRSISYGSNRYLACPFNSFGLVAEQVAANYVFELTVGRGYDVF